jgi:hypothetical protein
MQQNKAVQDQQEQHQECQENGRSDRHRLVGNPPDVSLQTRRHVDFKLSWLNKAAEYDRMTALLWWTRTSGQCPVSKKLRNRADGATKLAR